MVSLIAFIRVLLLANDSSALAWSVSPPILVVNFEVTKNYNYLKKYTERKASVDIYCDMNATLKSFIAS